MKFKELLKILQKEGWEIKKQKGSHIQLVHEEKAGKVTVPKHNKELKTGTLKGILKQVGL